MLVGTLLLLSASAAEIERPQPIVRDTEIGWKRRHGLGVVVGQPVGITGKSYLDRRGRHAIDASLGLQTRGGAYGHASYQFHPFPVLRTTRFEVPWRVGGGAFWRTAQQTVGLLGVTGLDLDVTDTPLQLFADLHLGLGIAPKSIANLGFSGGLRAYF